jgi:hypothetical protein
LPEIAKICNSKRFVDTNGKHVRENKRKAKPLKEQRKESGYKKTRSHKSENSIPIPIRATTTNDTRDD